MNREIKFRIWNEAKQSYRYSDEICYCGASLDSPQKVLLSQLSVLFNPNLGESCDDTTIIIQQFTGLRDKNGKDIYEGDILKTEDEILLVSYCEEYAKFGAIIYLQDGEEPENSVWHWGDDLFHTYSEIIGNLYENPDLLK